MSAWGRLLVFVVCQWISILVLFLIHWMITGEIALTREDGLMIIFSSHLAAFTVVVKNI